MNSIEAAHTFPITLTVTGNVLIDLLVTAAEGGSKYWGTFTVPAELGQTGEAYTAVRVREHDPHADGVPAFDQIIRAEQLVNGLQRLADCPEEGGPLHRDLALKYLAEAVGENGDAGTADVVMQMTVFGEVIYG